MYYFIDKIIFLLYLLITVLGQEYVNQAPTPTRRARIQDVYLRFYNGSSTDYFVQFPLSQSTRLLNINKFLQNNLTVFYAFGYTEDADDDDAKTMASSYIDTKPDTNFVLVDWSNMASGIYFTNAAVNTKTVGNALAAQLNILITNGVALRNIHLIGFSLGAQVMGYAGRELNETYGKTLPRITGLDPAFPSFYPDGALMEHIRSTDADFVDIIHTDAGEYGAPVSTGTADFWPNKGKALQPGCKLGIPGTAAQACSHNRAWVYYAESVRTPDAFPASPANSSRGFENNPTPEIGMVYMGYSCPSSAQRNYYLITNSESPYGKGMSGLRP